MAQEADSAVDPSDGKAFVKHVRKVLAGVQPQKPKEPRKRIKLAKRNRANEGR